MPFSMQEIIIKKIYAINQKKKLRSLFQMTNFEKRQQGYDAG